MRIRALTAACAAALVFASSAHATTITPGKVTSDDGLKCFADYLVSLPRENGPTFSIGRLTDQSGKFSNEGEVGGKAVSDGVQAMAYTALRKLGPNINVVERTDMSVMEAERQLSMLHLLGDDGEPADPVNNLIAGVHRLKQGQYVNADFYFTGGITAVDYKKSSGGGELFIAGIGGGKRVWNVTVTADVRVINARTGEMYDSRSVKTTVRGVETKAGVFNFAGDMLVDFSAGTKSEEEFQQVGVRSALELGILRTIGSVYGTEATQFAHKCADYVQSNSRR